MSADYKIATGPFHFCLDKAAVWEGFPRSAFVLDRTASTWRKEAYSCCLFCICFSRPPQPNRVYRTKSSASNEETIDTADKTITTTRLYIANEAKIGNMSAIDYKSAKVSRQ